MAEQSFDIPETKRPITGGKVWDPAGVHSQTKTVKTTQDNFNKRLFISFVKTIGILGLVFLCHYVISHPEVITALF